MSPVLQDTAPRTGALLSWQGLARAPLVKSTLFYAPAILLPRLAAFALILVLTRKISPANFGLYSLVLTVGELADTVGSSWVRITLLRLDTARPDSLRSGIRRSLALAVIGMGIAITVAALSATFLAAGNWARFTQAVALYVLANGCLRLALTVLQLRGRFVMYSLIEGGRALLMVAAAAFAVVIVSPTFFVASVATSCASLACAIGATAVAARGLPASQEAAAGYRERMRFGSPVIVLTLVAQLVINADDILLKLLASPATLGVYVAAYALGRQPIDIISNAVNMGGFPELVKRYEAGGKSAAARLLDHILAFIGGLGTLAAAGLWLLAIPIVHIALPTAYHKDGVIVLPLVAAATVLMNTKAFVFDNIFFIMRRNWLQTATYLPMGLAVVGADLLLIPKYGAIGAAFGMCAGMACGLATSVIVTRRFIRLRMPGWFGRKGWDHEPQQVA